MARIKNTDVYVFDNVPELSSFLIGSDQGDGRISKSYRLDTVFSLLPSLGYITDAPMDGVPYIRQDGLWQGVPPSGPGSVFNVFGRIGAVTALVGDYAAFYAPLVHTHTESDITDLKAYLLPSNIGTTVQAWNASLDLVSGTNTGDQLDIIGISSTKAQFNTALSNGSFSYVGDAPTAHTHVEADITDLGTYLESVNIANINATGTPSASTWLRGDGQWTTVPSVATVFGRSGAVVGEVGDYSTFYAPLAHTHVKANITDFSVDITDLNTTGTPSISTWLRGDGTWGTILGGVSSVYGRTAAVVAMVGDYSAFYAPLVHTHTVSEIIDFNPADYALLAHTHVKANITDFSVDIADINATGTADATTFLRGDGSWQVISASTAWGSITGTLADQTDLQSELDNKLNTSSTSQTKSGQLSVDRVRITSLSDASLISTVHGFQIGDTTATNIIMDNNEIMCRSNGAAGTLELQREGGNVNFGGSIGSTFTFGTTSILNISASASLVIQDNADLYIGTGTGEGRFFSNGSDVYLDMREDRNFYIRDVGTLRFTFASATGNLTATNFILSSDERLKENIRPVGIETIDIEWKKFNMIGNDEERYGVIAQELEVLHPEFVKTDEDGMKSVAYTDLLIAKNAELENRIKLLEDKLNILIKELL